MVAELKTQYLGMELNSPVIIGSCPLTIEPELVRQFADAGAGAIVLPSIMQEQIIHAQMLPLDPIGAVESSGYQPQQDKYNGGTEGLLATIRNLKSTQALPIIASINATSAGEWTDYAKSMEECGADALELNWQPAIVDPDETSDQIEQRLCDLVRQLCETVTIPVSVKLIQRFTNLASVSHKLHSAGAAGLVLFTHQPHWDVNIDRMHWTIRWELSPIDSLGANLEGIVRARTGQQDLSIAASGGVRTAEDAIKAMIAGADVVMVTSEIYRDGPNAARKIVEGIHRYLDTSHFDSLAAFQEARPKVQLGPQRLMRLEYVEPMTRSEFYYDPTPVASNDTCDSYGHQK
tara:strand:- start:14 stop:1057 length:1044 start_codon:yes stop_codon:yes gene_type:complete